MATTPTFNEFCKAHELSPREGKIVSLLMGGLSNPQIAKRLNTTEQCIKNAMVIAYRKIDIKGNGNNKKFRLLVAINEWVRSEKHRRVREKMDV